MVTKMTRQARRYTEIAGSVDKTGTGVGGTGVAVATSAGLARPSLYKVLLLNDDYTPMEFVVYVLMKVFNHNQEEATRIMLHVHRNGAGVGGVYPRDVADTKALRVMELAARAEHPLQCRVERT